MYVYLYGSRQLSILTFRLLIRIFPTKLPFFFFFIRVFHRMLTVNVSQHLLYSQSNCIVIKSGSRREKVRESGSSLWVRLRRYRVNSLLSVYVCVCVCAAECDRIICVEVETFRHLPLNKKWSIELMAYATRFQIVGTHAISRDVQSHKNTQ